MTARAAAPRTAPAAEAAPAPACRHCASALEHVFVDLGTSPPSNRYLGAAELARPEPLLPLKAYVCADCYLVQIEALATPEAQFSEYAYFSSFSETHLAHAERYASRMVDRLRLGPSSRVVEVASNDGYLLRSFVRRGIAVLGIEPAANVARVALARGIDTRVDFFGAEVAHSLVDEGIRADLLIANNVLAHVSDLADFVEGLAVALAPEGTLTIEAPHLLALIRGVQFDAIHHEHFSYFSLLSIERVLGAAGLRVFDVERLEAHGGSLRLFVCHANAPVGESVAVAALRAEEAGAGLDRAETYAAFAEEVRRAKRRLLTFLIGAKSDGRQVAAYGAAARGNTLLNYCGIRTDFIDYVVDRNPYKHGLFLPGTRIPIHPPERLFETKPDYVLILPWNLKDEIAAACLGIRDWGGRLVVPAPKVEILP